MAEDVQPQTIRWPTEMHEWLKEVAEEEGRSVSKQVVFFMGLIRDVYDEEEASSPLPTREAPGTIADEIRKRMK